MIPAIRTGTISACAIMNIFEDQYHLLSGRWLNTLNMEKLDLAKEYKSYYKAKAKPEIVEIEAAQYLSITGKGDPDSEDYAARVGALYAVAYTLKFIYKAQEKDFTVAKLEGQWWYDEARFGHPTMEEAPKLIPRSEWEYRMLIRLPEYVNRESIMQAIKTVVFKKDLSLAEEVALFTMKEGKCVQMLHVGPFSNEPETLKQINDFSAKHQLKRNGLHHEIYLSDYRKTAPEKLKTILREPVV
jgi:hypothetical protein